jgi:predicted RNA-binding Zn-ribbon protein involved in translation (DUF1610 family)
MGSGRTGLRCHGCGWEGQETDLVEKEGGLIYYDFLAKEYLGMEVTRSNNHCPKCDEILRSHRLMNGMVFDKW